MSDFVDKPIQKKINRKNLMTRLEKVEKKTGPAPSARVQSLDQLSPDLGDQIQGRFVAPSGDSSAGEPTDASFSGSFLAGDPQTPYDDAGAFNLGIVAAGVTTYGVGPTGSYAYGESFAEVHKATGTSTAARKMQSGMVELQGNTDPSYIHEFTDTAAGSNLITSNPGFETGDTTGWTLASGFAVSATSPLAGTYSLLTSSISSTATSNKYAVTAYTGLRITFKAYNASKADVTAYIRFYNATPTLLSTVTLQAWNAAATIPLATYSYSTTVPAGATQFDIYIVRGGTSVKNLQFDDFSVVAVTANNKFGFHGKLGRLVTLAEDNELGGITQGTGQITKWPFVVTGVASAGGSLDATVNYKYQVAFVDATGGVSLPNTISAAIATTGVNKQITLSGVPKRPPGCTAVRIYRTEGGGATPYYLTDLATDAVTYLDTAADGSLNTGITVATYNSTIMRPYAPPFGFIPASMILGSNTMALTQSSAVYMAYEYGVAAANAADGDYYSFGVFMAAGTYTMSMSGRTNIDSAKLDLYQDGVSIFTGDDWYAAAGAHTKTHAITFTTSGYHQFIYKVNGKNAASSDYTWKISFIQLTPTMY